MNDVGSNWAGNHAYHARSLHRPATVAEVQRIVASAARIRVLGTRHSFTDIADSDELLSLDGLPPEVLVDRTNGTVSCNAGLTYAALALELAAHGVALHNLASLPHISLAGAVATATHGSGDRSGNLATAVAALDLVTSSGDLVSVRRGDPQFEGMVVGLGALGAVVRLTLDVEPSYDVRQVSYRALDWEAVLDRLDGVTALGDSVSIFTTWDETIDQIWVKSRVDRRDDRWVPAELFGRPVETEDRHPIAGASAEHCTTQRGIPGVWSDRLCHFRAGFTPSSGDEIQSEYHVPRRHAVAAILAMRELGPSIRPDLLVAEIRSVAADELWMSGQYRTATIGIHCTWRPHPVAVLRSLAAIEAALAPFGARPHWGKVFVADAATIAPLYPRRDDFVALATRLDARGAFRNAWFTERVLGDDR